MRRIIQVVSGPIGRQKVYFEAPPAEGLQQEVTQFLDWLNRGSLEDHAILKAGIAHLWFVTLHPFDDGNGRIARAVGDLLLARADGTTQRSLSAQIAGYYDILEKTQKGTLDITHGLSWYLATLLQAIREAQLTLNAVLLKANFWQRWSATSFNERQINNSTIYRTALMENSPQKNGPPSPNAPPIPHSETSMNY